MNPSSRQGSETVGLKLPDLCCSFWSRFVPELCSWGLWNIWDSGDLGSARVHEVPRYPGCHIFWEEWPQGVHADFSSPVKVRGGSRAFVRWEGGLILFWFCCLCWSRHKSGLQLPSSTTGQAPFLVFFFWNPHVSQSCKRELYFIWLKDPTVLAKTLKIWNTSCQRSVNYFRTPWG